MNTAQSNSWNSFVNEWCGLQNSDEKFPVGQWLSYLHPRGPATYCLRNSLLSDTYPSTAWLCRVSSFWLGTIRSSQFGWNDGVIIVSISTNKAPGEDLIKGFVRQAYAVIREYLHRVFTTCIQLVCIQNLKIFLKDMPVSFFCVKKNRLITLLSEYGKALEKLIRNIVQ